VFGVFQYLEFEFEASPSGAFPSILAMTDILNGINQTLELNHTNIPVSICKFLGKLLKRSSGSNGVAASAVAEQSRREAELRFLFEHSNVLDVCFELLKTLVANLPLWSCFDSANSFMDLVIELCLLTKHMLFQNPTMRSKFFDVLHGRQALKSILQHISSASFQLEAGSGASILLADTLSAVLDVWRSMTDFESIAHLLQSCFETRSFTFDVLESISTFYSSTFLTQDASGVTASCFGEYAWHVS
jgi:hypothetical protein